MHQHADRGCTEEAIGGAHHGPVTVYLSKVSDSATADPSAGGWFKIFEDGWAKNPSGGSGDDDYWGTKDLNTCCGRMNVLIPSDIANGDYLLRAEALALHSANSPGGAQFYMSCFQLSVTGGSGTGNPATVKFPGAYSSSDPGITINIHAALSGYKVPGPPVYAGGSTKKAGSACTGCESGSCKPGSSTGTVIKPTQTASPGGGDNGGGGNSGCTVNKYQQCGGTGYTGCTNCAAGSTCNAVSPPYYHQCL